MFDDINSILELNIDNPIYLQVVNGLVDPKKVVDFDVLISYMTEQNKKYCDDHDLCPECRSEMKQFVEMEDGMISEWYWSCRNGC